MGGWGWGVPRTRTVFVPVGRGGGGGGYSPPPPGPGGRDVGNGCLSVVMGVAILVLLLGIFITIAGSFGGAGGSVAASTVQREPLPAGSVTETGYYTDELGWIVDETMLVRGMRDFYKATGVQPYLYLTDNVDGNTEPSANEMGEFSARLYDQLFQDEGHFLLVYQEAWGNYMVGYTAGTQAKSIMDDEAVGILRDYLDRYYYDTSSLSDEEYFSKVFQETALRIMTVTKSPFARARERSSTAFFSWTVPGEKVLETCSRRSKSATLLHLPPEPVKLELLPNRGPGDGGGHNDGGDQLEVLGPHVGGQGGGDDDAVKHRPQHGG